MPYVDFANGWKLVEGTVIKKKKIAVSPKGNKWSRFDLNTAEGEVIRVSVFFEVAERLEEILKNGDRVRVFGKENFYRKSVCLVADIVAFSDGSEVCAEGAKETLAMMLECLADDAAGDETAAVDETLDPHRLIVDVLPRELN